MKIARSRGSAKPCSPREHSLPKRWSTPSKCCAASTAAYSAMRRKKKELARMRDFIGNELRRVERRVLAADVQIAAATSGTAAALYDWWMARNKRNAPEARTVPTPAVVDAATKLARTPLRERR